MSSTGEDTEVEFNEKDAEKVQVSHLVPEHVREAAKARAEYGELSEKVRRFTRPSHSAKRSASEVNFRGNSIRFVRRKIGNAPRRER